MAVSDCIRKSEFKKYLNSLSDEELIEIIEYNNHFFALINPSRQTNALCLIAVQKNPMNFKYIVNPTEELCIELVSLNSYLLSLITNQTTLIIQAALKNDPYAKIYIRPKCDSTCLRRRSVVICKASSGI